ncbi:MAG: peptide-methionine (S)-S-oxide reductase MsrA [Bacteroidales bacterium]|nr:peptide-methionine (S)-S-oxide reductase MsrA [Bacteroidales bacterium]
MIPKDKTYELISKQIAALCEGENDPIAKMANVAALLHETFHFWWTGFYRVVDDELLLGPFQGPVACMHIGYGKGVCGTAWQQKCTQVVPDVEAFPGHIACSSQSKSEIVVPILEEGRVVAVLDIDSAELNTFDATDKHWLEQIVALMSPRWNAYPEIYMAGGCFWGTEHYLKQLDGVVFTEVGYANGNTENPSYQEVYTDTTGYAETVHLRYDPSRIGLHFLTEMYFKAIDPTSLNKQGHDEGTRYRTGIYFTDEHDVATIREVFDAVAAQLDAPLQVELLPLSTFHAGEEYHQAYLDKNPNGYCHLPLELFAAAKAAKDPSRG